MLPITHFNIILSVFSYQEEQRAAIERKLEEKGRAEKEELRRERLELFNQRKERQAQIRRLTIKMARVKEVRRLDWVNTTIVSQISWDGNYMLHN